MSIPLITTIIFLSALNLLTVFYVVVLKNRVAKATKIANLAKVKFLENMSHELRTPMNGIIGAAKILDMTLKENPAHQYVKLLKKSAYTMLKYVEDLLDLSSLSEATMALDSKKMSITEIVEKTIDLISQQVSGNNITISFSVAKNVPMYVLGDYLRLQQILINLLSNSIKFTPSGRITLEVFANTSNNLAEVSFLISDTGVGIEKEIIANIFEPFMQGDVGYAKKFQGAGLGLAITKELVNLMKGSISVESKVGKGSIFTVKIPFKISLNNSVGAPAFKQNLSELRILLAEDNKFSKQLFSIIIEDIFPNAIITVVTNCDEVVKEIEAANFDIIFMDLHMPKLCGIEATQLIRTNYGEKGKNIPIIATTTYVMDDDKKRFLEAGMTDFLAKPIDMHDMAKLINHYVETDSN